MDNITKINDIVNNYIKAFGGLNQITDFILSDLKEEINNIIGATNEK